MAHMGSSPSRYSASVMQLRWPQEANGLLSETLIPGDGTSVPMERSDWLGTLPGKAWKKLNAQNNLQAMCRY